MAVDLRLAGKRAFVVGGSRGIGRAIAHRFAEEGVNVGICARGEGDLSSTADELRKFGVGVHARSSDARDSRQLDVFLEEAKRALTGVDILVNNVSALNFGGDEESWRLSLDVDLLAAVRASRKVAPWMADAGGGVIVHMSSITGLEAGWPPAYAAAKAGLISHAKTLSVALAPQKVRVIAVAPGPIEFPNGVWDKIKHDDRAFYDKIVGSNPWKRMGTPEEIADVVVFLASGRASWVTGVCIAVDGGQHKGNL